MVFLFNNILYYPYGGSSDNYRNLMPSNLMLYKACLWGKENGAKLFDLWGALGPNPDPTDPWIGFHRFKEGYGARHVEYIGSYDFVLNPILYSIYNIADNIRWKILRLRK
ncbi:peptidoglycan bridge formation glycyltransferase FemA/FemB family protein [Candidatus Gottesmanbacteria bacterium]|nr:peptidoglycan bridge formation glycyltransferase FemA/FemB family protein [Candidatus Gottesmanbacteria bacterium]